MRAFFVLTLTISSVFFITSTAQMAQASPVSLSDLTGPGNIISTGNGTGSASSSKQWAELTDLMSQVSIFDPIVDRISNILCSNQTNRSVLLVGPPSDTYRYIIARLATKPRPKNCTHSAFAEIDVSRMQAESGPYTNATEQYWQNKIMTPLAGKDVILLFPSLAKIVGTGSHSNDSSGIEVEYVDAIRSGRLTTISVVSPREYQTLMTSVNAYVPQAFAETLRIEEITPESAQELVNAYIKQKTPRSIWNPKLQKYFRQLVDFYRPNTPEPQRSMDVAKAIVRNQIKNATTKSRTVKPDPSIESAHPYGNNANQTFEVSVPGATSISIEFDYIDTEPKYDMVSVLDPSGNTLVSYTERNLEDVTTDAFPFNNLSIVLRSDSGTNYRGFRVKQLHITEANAQEITREHLRQALFEIAQIPQWMVTRDFKVIQNLSDTLNKKVIGCEQAKEDLTRLSKLGYVAGRTDVKPIGSVLLAGSTGTGKSFIAKQFAKAMGLKLITIDMTQYTSTFATDRFIEVLSQSLITDPYAVYLFEEIDKASTAALDKLYFLLDEGLFYDNDQRPLFARGAFILATTNAAESLVLADPNRPDLNDVVARELQKNFRPSFVNRFDAISVFKPFTPEHFRKLAEVMIKDRQQALEERHGWKLEVAPNVVDFLVQYGQSDLYGARPIERLTETVVNQGIADFELSVGPIDEDALIKIVADPNVPGRFTISVNKKQSHTYIVDLEVNSGGKP